jgi:hypothetical protein
MSENIKITQLKQQLEELTEAELLEIALHFGFKPDPKFGYIPVITI